MRNYRRDTVVGFVGPGTKLLVLGLILSLLTALLILISLIDESDMLLFSQQIGMMKHWARIASELLFIVSIILILSSIIFYLCESDSSKIRRKVRKALFLSVNGNPLGFCEGELLPNVKCSKYGNGLFKLTISAGSCTTETIEKASTSISSALNGRHRRYAVTRHETDLAFNEVTFYLEDVMADRVIVRAPARYRDAQLCCDLIILTSPYRSNDYYNKVFEYVSPARQKIDSYEQLCPSRKNGDEIS